MSLIVLIGNHTGVSTDSSTDISVYSDTTYALRPSHGLDCKTVRMFAYSRGLNRFEKKKKTTTTTVLQFTHDPVILFLSISYQEQIR